MSHITYIASPNAAGIGHTTHSGALVDHAATLLVKPGTDHDTLCDCLTRLNVFIGLDDNRRSRNGSQAPISSGAMGSIAISWSPTRPNVPESKREGPMFGGDVFGPVAFVVDADFDRHQVSAALLELTQYAIGHASDFLEPLQA